MAEIEKIKFPEKAKEIFSNYVARITSAPAFDLYATDRAGLQLLGYAVQKAMLTGLQEARKQSPEQAQEAERFLAVLEAYRNDACLAFSIQNCPVDLTELPPTPVTRQQWWSTEKIPDAELFSLAVHYHVGDFPASMPGMQNGAFFQTISPRIGDEGSYASRGAAEFPPHTDRSFDEVPTKAISLLALRQSEGAHTGIIFIDDLLETLKVEHPGIEEDLKTTEFFFSSNDSFLKPDGTKGEIGVRSTIIKEDQGKTFVRINLAEGSMKPLDGENGKGANLLKILHSVIDAHPELDHGCTIQPGEMLAIRNDIGALHFRRAFEPDVKDVTQRRWLIRVCTETNNEQLSK